MITKRQLLEVFDSAAAVGRMLGCRRATVSAWKMDEPIPVSRELQLKLLFPEKFGKAKAKDVVDRLLKEHGRPRKENAEPPRSHAA